MQISQFIKAPIARPFLSYKLGGGGFALRPHLCPHESISPPPPVKSPFSLKYKQNIGREIEFRREV
jgi:hypothetical protein